MITIGHIISSRPAKYMLRVHPLPQTPFDCQFVEISKQGLFDFYDVNERLVSVDWGIPSEVESTA